MAPLSRLKSRRLNFDRTVCTTQPSGEQSVYPGTDVPGSPGRAKNGTGVRVGSTEVESHQVAFHAEELDLHLAGPGGPPAGNVVGQDQPLALGGEVKP
jgi:hypothetical protein